MSNLRTSAALLGLILGAVAGCAQPAGPVFGDWRGTQPSGAAEFSKSVELVLNGPSNARSGTYQIATTDYNSGLVGGNDTRRWGGSWTSEQRVVDGQTQTIIHLHNILPGAISTYELASDGSLHVVDPNGQVDGSPDAKLFVLSPVPRGPRYGRD
jgi:hypothetical protein